MTQRGQGDLQCPHCLRCFSDEKARSSFRHVAGVLPVSPGGLQGAPHHFGAPSTGWGCFWSSSVSAALWVSGNFGVGLAAGQGLSFS